MCAEIVPFGLSRADRFTVEPHAIEGMLLRDISDRQMLATMLGGHVNQGPMLDACHDWRCRIKKRVVGRLVRVVVAIHDMSWLYVISVH
jgi:hypothetical protein